MKKQQVIDFLNSSEISEEHKNRFLDIIKEEGDDLSIEGESQIRDEMNNILDDIAKGAGVDFSKDEELNNIESKIEEENEEMNKDLAESEDLLKSLDFVERDLEIADKE